ncbi:hypothetical protein BDA96_04G030000 [Sorghum bicolor]|uniref:Uncharacterized protein n=2 Tax=Sorghum bicolor TaxID=4558 RepID=A0A921R184_SORBI|nr:hypothetical protein BDA96_04G030000 [Sorghum bicolor]
MLLSASTEESDPQMDFYGGPQIFNTVTWPLDGPAWKVKGGHLYASGHQRLWHFIRGQLLDVSSVLGPDMVIFTTAMFGTFYSTITFEDHSVTLPIDGREGWNYRFENEHGCFEYYHLSHDCPYLANERNWSMLRGCLPDYSEKGLCPTGNHVDVEMGIPAARRACKTLSTYKGELPVPPEVRKACATLITYSIEAMKSNEVLDWTCGTLEDEEEELTLNMLHPYASPRIKRWKLLGQSKLHYLVRRLNCEEDIFPIIPAVTGIQTTEGVLDSVCVLPYNQLFRQRTSKARDWSALPLDENADMAGGRPHFLSAQFARPWPTNHKLAVLRSPDTMINAPSILPFAKVKKQNSGSGELPNARTFSPGAGAALRIQKRNLCSVDIPNARRFSSGACAALRILKTFVK